MLFKTPEEFLVYVSNIKSLSREEELSLFSKIQEPEARNLLIEGYLPVLSMYLKRSFHPLTLEIIYRGLAVLETSVDSFDFQKDNPTFSKFLGIKVRQMFVSYIANK